ncbi:MAG: dTDP-4-dehydrorhamnose reductase [Porphyromonadaceae bacterium]|nr:dTDP-4-dehydrorhamnose reductase [Porphyromonadaceae bacterium]
MSKNILVTGANGQLGSEIRVIADSLTDNYIFTDVEELDITDKNAVDNFIKMNDVQVVVNCAAYTQVDQAEDDEVLADKINHQAVRILAEACLENFVLLIHISTDYVFDGTRNKPYTEDVPTAPLGVYGKTKLAGELAVDESGCNFIIIRTSWLYSMFGTNFVKTMQRLTSEKDELKVVFDQIGTPTYAADLAKLIVKIVENEDFWPCFGIYHYSNEGVCSWYDFAIEIRDLLGNECDIRPCHSDEFPSKVKRPHYSVLDKTKVKDIFEIEIPHWKTSLARCIKLLS